jgi:hypothetical protein
MTCKTIIVAVALGVTLGAPQALAQKQSRATTCVDSYPRRSVIETIFSTGPAPQANGCAPAVNSGGRFVGQDPDPNIRLQLRRDSDNEDYHLNMR